MVLVFLLKMEKLNIACCICMTGMLILNILNKIVTLKLNNGLQDWKTEHQAVTKAKIKRAESASLKGSETNKLYRRLIMKYSEMPASF